MREKEKYSPVLYEMLADDNVYLFYVNIDYIVDVTSKQQYIVFILYYDRWEQPISLLYTYVGMYVRYKCNILHN